MDALEKGSIRLVVTLAMTLTLAMAVAGCDWFNNDSSPSSTTANTETFSGSLAQGGSVMFTFTVAKSGAVNVTLTSLTPSSSAGVGLGVGTPSGTTCTVTASTSSAVAGSTAQLTSTETPGSYCVKVSDAGGLTAPATVTVTVSHS
jgi:hypothetical protein